MLLAQLMQGQDYRLIHGSVEVPVSGLTHDSRRVVPGNVFFCLPGRTTDGHDFAGVASAGGAVAVVAERPLVLPSGVSCLLVANSRRSLALAAAAFWGHPSSRLRLFAVTGTNGKTTVNHLTQAFLDVKGGRSGLIGTVENRVGDRATPSSLTTPDALEIQASLAAMVADGATRACLEASSHGLAGHRLDGCEVDVAVLTNVTRDHLEFHQDVSTYAATKLSLFKHLGASRTKDGQVYAVLNRDDSFFDSFRAKLTVPLLTYGVRCASHVKMLGAVLEPGGSRVRVAFSPRPLGLPGAEWLRAAPGWPECSGTCRKASRNPS
jgi:UDP-N-acetylmuramoyl-L-alanyl-D-glutamate--2,6-diaminopimelate ligase